MDHKITLIIITYNREYYIKRLLEYYKSINFDQKIIVTDASDRHIAERNKKLYNKIKETIDLSVKFSYGQGYVESISSILGDITTPYSIMNPDDDFLIPSALAKMATFLDKNKNYQAVNGMAILAMEKEFTYRNRIVTGVDEEPMRAIYGSNATERIYNLFHNYFVVQFSLIKTSIFKRVFSTVAGNDIVSNEYIPALRLAAFCNIANIDDVFLVRSDNPTRINIPPLSVAILNNNWCNSIGLLKGEFCKLTDCTIGSRNKLLNFELIFSKFYKAMMARHSVPINKNIVMKFFRFLKTYKYRGRIKGYVNPFFDFTCPSGVKCVIKSIEGK
jgi:glycosyltransferase domain-containing protein